MSSDFYVTPPRDVNEGSLTSNVPLYCAPEWAVMENYYIGQFVHRLGNFYRAKVNGTANQAPDTHPAEWALETDELLFAPWDGATTYAEGDKIAVNYAMTSSPGAPENAAKIYASRVSENVGNSPPTSPDQWLEIADVYWPKTAIGGAGYVGRRVIYKRRVYEALTTASGGPDPSTSADWLDVGLANRWAMFDSLTSTQTTMPIDIVNTIQISGRIDTIGLLNIIGESVSVKVMDGATEVYNKTIDLSDETLITDWWEYYFGDFYYRSSLFLRDIPTIMNPTVTVTIYGSGTSERAIGHLLLGQSFYIGKTEMGADVGIENYSRIVTNEFGERSIVERGYSDQGNFKVIVDRNRTDAVKKVLTDLRATPCLYVATDTLDSTIYFGLASFRVGFEYPFHSRVSISVEGF